MGTRGLHGFVLEEREYLTYCHFDSYPSGLGIQVLEFLRAGLDSLDGLRKKVAELELINDQDKPTPEHMQRLGDRYKQDVGTGADYYALMRDLQGDLAGYLQVGLLPDAAEFAIDSLFCEWAYVIDLDAERFEVYRGFQTEPHSDGRFADRGPRIGGDGKPDHKYKPIRLVSSWSFRDLPTNGDLIELEEATYTAENEEA